MSGVKNLKRKRAPSQNAGGAGAAETDHERRVRRQAEARREAEKLGIRLTNPRQTRSEGGLTQLAFQDGTDMTQVNDMIDVASEHLRTKKEPIWCALDVLFNGRRIGHSFLIRRDGSSIQVADINGSTVFNDNDMNIYYKALLEGIRDKLGYRKNSTTFYDGPAHDHARIYAAAMNYDEEAGCSQYAIYVYRSKLFLSR